MLRSWFGVFVVIAALSIAGPARATAVFTGSTSTNDGLSARAEFTIVGTTLQILLTNTDAFTGSVAPNVPSEILTGLFFNIGGVTLVPVSATIVSGGSIVQGNNCLVASDCSTGDYNVGGEWSYSPLDASWLAGTQQGISSSGYLPSNSSAGNFNGPNLEDPTALNGVEFGIVPDGWLATNAGVNANGGVTSNALIEGSVLFVLDIPTGVTVTESMISNVSFTYGTNSNEPNFKGYTTSGAGSTSGAGTTGGVPEPAVLSLLGLALAAVCYRARR